jgi:aspartate-semialdehyde dehydrogenase
MAAGQSGLRIVLAGATGTLARDVIDVLEGRDLPVEEILPFATGASLGEEIEFRGQSFAVQDAMPSLRGVDLVLVCTPPGPALDVIRQALRAEAPCVDCSGSLSDSRDVPLLVSALANPSSVLGAPLIATPAGPTLALALVLAPLVAEAGLERFSATLLRSVSRAGRRGIDALSRETLALLGQQEVPELDCFETPVAFDCIPLAVEFDLPESEARTLADLERLLPAGDEAPEPGWLGARGQLQAVQVPAFVSDAATLSIETQRPLSAEEARERLSKAPGVECDPDAPAPSMRDAAGSDCVLVGRVDDTGGETGLRLWLAADSVRLSAVNAVDLAETRLRFN